MRSAIVLCLLGFVVPLQSQEKKPSLPVGTLNTAEWLKASTAKLESGEIDKLVGQALQTADLKPAPLVSDELFVRRVHLDLVGKLPTPADVVEFLKDKSSDKRSALVDKLLASDDFARHWAVYWREVISSRSTDFRGAIFTRHFERWLTKEIKENRNWSEVVRAMLTATGQMRYDDADKNGQAYFLNSRTGADANTELASETSRIFLGIQIQCAQCHDHPSDVWKRQQFHEFAAYFARLKSRLVREEKKFVGQELISFPFGEHQMPGKDDPKSTTRVMPKFIDGKAPRGFSLNDAVRRKSLAESIVSKENPWFAGAYVNRIWGELMGQAFYGPIDDMGPEKEATMPQVLARVAGAFRGSDYDVKQLFRAICLSDAYQREVRPGEGKEDHLLFASRSPTRLNSEALWKSLNAALGGIESLARPFGGKGMFGGGFGRFGGIETTFKREFAFDPSAKPEEVEGSVSQALLLMNNAAINQKIQAKSGSILGRILETYSSDDEALRAVYMKTLARRPTERELTRCKEHIQKAPSRAEAYEDLLWALINSTEFLTKR